jgi:hypothetical protein
LVNLILMHHRPARATAPGWTLMTLRESNRWKQSHEVRPQICQPMQREIIEHLMRRKPFKPFSIRLSTNEILQIKHPETIYLAKTFLAIAFTSPEAEDVGEGGMIWIDYDHIVYCYPLPKREIPF